MDPPIKIKDSKIKKARKLKEEPFDGNIEYKWKLCDFKTNNRKQRLVTQMHFRLQEGEGIAIYNLGYTDAGDPIGISYEIMMRSLSNFHEICDIVGSEIKSIKIFKGIPTGYCANIYLHKDLDDVKIFTLDDLTIDSSDH